MLIKQVFLDFSLIHFIAAFIAITYMMSFGGWRQLARSYKTNIEFVGDRLNWQTAIINTSKYGGGINIGVNLSGIHLSGIFLLCLTHPPLFIPWP